jgi:hypothetical protein
MIATSGLLLRYAAELKPYSLDAAVAAALALVAIRELKVEGTGRIPWRLLLTGCVALLLSLPSAFVCAGAVAAVGFTAIRRRDTRGIMVAVGLAAVWATLFVATYEVWYRPVASSPYMQQFWEATFLRPGTPALAARFGQAWEDTALGVSVLGGFIPGFLAALALLGLVVVAHRRSIPVALILGAPILLAFAGSVAGRYPIASRTTLFAAPALAILIGAALESLIDWARHTVARIPAQAAACVLVIFPALIAARLTFAESESEDVEAAVRQFVARADAAEPVYLYHRATTSWTFYTTDWKRPDIRRLAWTARVAGPDGPGFTNAPPRGPRRADDGADLVYEVAGRTELLGTASGIRARHWLGYQPSQADSGWVDNEVRRIQSAARPTIWLVFADHLHGPIRDGEWLVDGVRQAGGVIEWADEHPYWALYRVRFNRPASP